jgi:hypothetical protein
VKSPVRRNRPWGSAGKATRITIDVLAVKRAAAAGTLKAEDRRTVEKFLPGILGTANVKLKSSKSSPEVKHVG